jgi:ribosomal protein S18 acetylase RimI-like enzyme
VPTVSRRGTGQRSGLAPFVTVSVRLGERSGAEAASDRAYVKALGRRSVMSSVSSLRPAPEPMVRAAFERLCDIVENQSHVTLIAQRDDKPVGFLLMLDELPDEVTSMPQGFIAYMAVEPQCQGEGVGTALLAAAEDEARRRGLAYIALMVSEENEAARRLYTRGGYQTERRLLCKPL